MLVIAKVIGVSLLTAVLFAGVGWLFLVKNPEAVEIAVVIGCVGSLIGALAGAAREIVTALRHED